MEKSYYDPLIVAPPATVALRKAVLADPRRETTRFASGVRDCALRHDLSSFVDTKVTTLKRFTETEKWHDPWFRRLSPELKCFWLFVLDNCDLAGVWKVDMEIANIFICGSLTEEIVLAAMPGRFKKIDDTHWHITKFIPFQYGELKPECRPHQAVIRLLDKSGIRLPDKIPYPKGIGRVSDTLQDKDKDKDKGKDGETERKENPSLIRARSLFNKRLSTPLDDSERRAWSKAQSAVEATDEEEWQLLEWAYTQRSGNAHQFRRHDMATLLNNWNTEIDRARGWKREATRSETKVRMLN